MRRAATVSIAIVLSVAGSLALSSCLTLRAVVAPKAAHAVATDVAYVAPDHGVAVDDKQRLDVWAPDDAHGAPVVIFVHGGYWNSGDRRYLDAVTGLYGNFGRALGADGVVTVLPSYRLFPRVSSIEPMLDDLAAVVRWTHEHIAAYGGSPDKIVLAGHSAGGHLVLQLVTAPHALEQRGIDATWVKGVAPISGVFDVARATRLSDDEMRAALWRPLFGARPDAWSPLRQLSVDAARATPMLFFVGSLDENDCLLDFNDAHTALAAVEGSSAFFRTIEGNNHRDMVLEVDTAADQVTPALAAFARQVTTTTSPTATTTTTTAPPAP
jgi:acetyl esterase/lipase